MIRCLDDLRYNEKDTVDRAGMLMVRRNQTSGHAI